MALPADFWKNDQLLNIIRTRPCIRFQKCGQCDWKSQCQYSHNLAWPRRPPSRHNYSVELCRHVHVKGNGSEATVEVKCPKDKECGFAHSKEEMLYHPHLFKTIICEEYKNSDRAKGSKPGRCHRYYCPFAHGEEELRPSPLSLEEREALISQTKTFPRDDCCEVCSPSRSASVSCTDGTPASPQQASPPRKNSNTNKQGRYSPSFQPTDPSMQGGQYMSYRGWMQGGDMSGYSNGCGEGGSMMQQNGCKGGQVQPMMQASPNQMGQGQAMMQFVAMAPGGCMPAGQGGMQIMQLAMPASSPQGGDMAGAMIQFNHMTSPQQGGHDAQQDSSPTDRKEVDVSSLLVDAGLEHLADDLKRNGIENAEDFASLTDERIESIGLAPHDQLRLHRALDSHRAKAAGNKQVQAPANCWMAPTEGMRSGMAMQPVMMNGYGQWMSPTCTDGYMMWPQASMGQMYCQTGNTQQVQQSNGCNGAQYMQAPPFPLQQQPQMQMTTASQMMIDGPSRDSMQQTPPPHQNGNSMHFNATPPPLPVPEKPTSWEESCGDKANVPKMQVIEIPFDPVMTSDMPMLQNGMSHQAPEVWLRQHQGETVAITG